MAGLDPMLAAAFEDFDTDGSVRAAAEPSPHECSLRGTKEGGHRIHGRIVSHRRGAGGAAPGAAVAAATGVATTEAAAARGSMPQLDATLERHDGGHRGLGVWGGGTF